MCPMLGGFVEQHAEALHHGPIGTSPHRSGWVYSNHDFRVAKILSVYERATLLMTRVKLLEATYITNWKPSIQA